MEGEAVAVAAPEATMRGAAAAAEGERAAAERERAACSSECRRDTNDAADSTLRAAARDAWRAEGDRSAGEVGAAAGNGPSEPLAGRGDAPGGGDSEGEDGDAFAALADVAEAPGKCTRKLPPRPPAPLPWLSRIWDRGARDPGAPSRVGEDGASSWTGSSRTPIVASSTSPPLSIFGAPPRGDELAPVAGAAVPFAFVATGFAEEPKETAEAETEGEKGRDDGDDDDASTGETTGISTGAGDGAAAMVGPCTVVALL